MPADRRRPPRLRPIAPGTIADNVRASEGVSDEELVARLYDALADLPPAERAAAVVAFGLGEGHHGVAEELGIDADDADALTRNALQLLRSALGDVDLDDPVFYGRLERRRGHRTARPD
jgi:DNA-directed RNA polymerase specialized sigma24 family protein